MGWCWWSTHVRARVFPVFTRFIQASAAARYKFPIRNYENQRSRSYWRCGHVFGDLFGEVSQYQNKTTAPSILSSLLRIRHKNCFHDHPCSVIPCLLLFVAFFVLNVEKMLGFPLQPLPCSSSSHSKCLTNNGLCFGFPARIESFVAGMTSMKNNWGWRLLGHITDPP